MEKTYLKKNAERVLEFARELNKQGEISYQQLQDTYFHNFIIKEEEGEK